jgi:RimJ/RimL family protein N-acetyltransferase
VKLLPGAVPWARMRDMKPPILVDFPEGFETERLSIRSPLPGDGPEVHRAIRESIDELTPWMAWPKEHRTVDDSEASARRARVAFLARSEIRLHLYLKGADELVGIAGLQSIDWDVPKFEVGYWCRTSFTGNGYITEAVKAITYLAFDALGGQTRRDPLRPRQPQERKGRRTRRLHPGSHAPQQRTRYRRNPSGYAGLRNDTGPPKNRVVNGVGGSRTAPTSAPPQSPARSRT